MDIIKNKIKAGIIGAAGYAGIELLRLLLNHPFVEVSEISSISFEGKKISEIYPSFYKIFDKVLTDADTVIEKSDIIFASLPHGLCEDLAKKCIDKGKYFIDFGADFRLDSEEDYTKWYGGEYKEKELHKQAVYGLTELFSDEIKNAKLIANPGCYPTSIALALAPIISEINEISPVIDSKSGTTGAGKGLAQNLHYAECNESFSPYKIAAHRHTPEIEQSLSKLAGKNINITFVPHLLPINRGIISTIYISLKEKKSLDEIYNQYINFYSDKPFIRILEKGNIANLKNVRFSNYCDISLHIDEHTNRIIIVSAIDNMVKGAAGQAIQNMNIMFKLPEVSGLTIIPPVF